MTNELNYKSSAVHYYERTKKLTKKAKVQKAAKASYKKFQHNQTIKGK